MQIHELNNFSGTLGAGSYLAIDNGTDTGRISSQGLLASTEARIDAANDQITDVKSDINDNTSDISALQASVTNLGTHKVAQPLDGNNQPTNGTSGQSLRTKGDGTTEWADVGLPTDAQTAQAVSDWLDAHPEATTTVQDGSISESKFTQAVKRKFDLDIYPNTLFGYSRGSVVLDYNYAPSSFGKYGNKLYILCFSRTSDTGKCVEVNLSTNKVVGETDIYLAHANSCASVASRNCHYVCPNHTYEGIEHGINKVLKYNNDFTSYTEISTNYPFLGVSYDSTTDTVYLYDRTSKKLCILNADNSIEEVGVISGVPNVDDYNQDIACHDNYLYLCGFKGEFIKVYIPTLEIIAYGNISHDDGARKYQYDEQEGWEFDADGNLWQIMYSKFRNIQSFGIYTQIGLTNSFVKMPKLDIADPGFTANITTDSMTNFDNYESYFKHPNEVNIAKEPFNTLSIQTDTNFGNVVFENDVVVNNGLICDTLIVRCATVYFDNVGSYKVDIGSINQEARGAIITFAGSNKSYRVRSYSAGGSGSTIILKSGVTFIDGNGDPDISGFSPMQFPNPTKYPIIFVNQLPIHNAVRAFLESNFTIEAGAKRVRTYTVSNLTNALYDVVCKVTETDKNITINTSRSQSGNTLTIYVSIFNNTASDISIAGLYALLFPYATA